MRGYATVIATLIVFVVLVSAGSILFVSTLRYSSERAKAEHFRSFAEERAEKTALTLLSYDWNDDTNILTVRIRNDGVPVSLDSVRFFVDGKYAGSCASLSCKEANPDGELLTDEEINAYIPITYLPYRVSASAGPYGVTALYSELNNWHSGCKYRRLVFVRNSGTSVSGLQVAVDLDANFDYSKADPSNILMTAADGLTEIPFWVEYWNVSGNSRIWVLIDVPASDSNYVFLYYGCDSVPTYTPADVFLHDIAGLVAYWPLDENSGSVARDVSGNGYDMNIYGATWVSGYRGSAVYLDGGTDSYLIRNPFNGFPSNAMTVLFWMDTNDTTNNGVPISYASSSTPDDFALMNYQNLRVYVAGNYKIPGLAFNDGAWHSVAAAWRSSDGNVSVFDNGSLAYTSTLSDGNTITDGGSFVVGQDQDSVGGGFQSSQAFIGVIDEIMVFSAFLSPAEIHDIYSEDYFVSAYYPSHLLVKRRDPGTVVEVREEEVYSTGSNK